jgi:hypothetical protein
LPETGREQKSYAGPECRIPACYQTGSEDPGKMIQNQREAGSNQLHVFWMHALLQILLIWYIAPVREKIRMKIKKNGNRAVCE